MALKVAIVDDSAEDAAYIGALTESWAITREISLRAETFASAEAFLFRCGEAAFDLLLLDVEMGGMDGVTLAKRVRGGDENIQIVFITGYSDYIAEGYDVAALHYLMKPVDSAKFRAVMDRAAEKLRGNQRVINIEARGALVRIPLRELQYLDVFQNYVTLHAKEEYTVKRPLKEFEKDLDDRFFRVGRGLIVNLEHVGRVTKSEIALIGGKKLPLPRGAYKALNRAIIDHG